MASVLNSYQQLLESLGCPEGEDQYWDIQDGYLCTYTDISTHGTLSYRLDNKRPLTYYERTVLNALLSIRDDIQAVDKVIHARQVQQKINDMHIQIKRLEEELKCIV